MIDPDELIAACIACVVSAIIVVGVGLFVEWVEKKMRGG